MSTPDSSSCASCAQPVLHSDATLFCRGCGWKIHAVCLKGPKLCPRCSKPLVTPSRAAKFEGNRARAKRAIEYRITASCVGGGLYVSTLAAALQMTPGAWNPAWLGIPFGTWANTAVCLLSALMAMAFVRLRRPSLAMAAVSYLSLVGCGFLIGAVCSFSFLTGEHWAFLQKLSLPIAATPMGVAIFAWWEFGRWKSIPGDSGGIALDSSESMLAPLMEVLQNVVPLFWGPPGKDETDTSRKQRKK